MRKFLTFYLLAVSFSLHGQSDTDSASLYRRNFVAYDLYLNNPDSAVSIATATLAVALKENIRYVQGQSFMVLSKAHWAKSNFRLSIEYGYKALQVVENTSYIPLWHHTVLTLERDFVDSNEPGQAQKLINTALTIAEKANDQVLLADTWREYSYLLLHRKQYDSAITFADRSLKVYQQTGDKIMEGIIYSRKSSAYFMKKDYVQSIVFNKKSIRLDKMTNNKRLLSIDLYQAAENCLLLNNIDSALINLRKSDSLARFIGNIRRSIICHELYAVILEKQGKQTEAIHELRSSAKMKDSLNRRETTRLVAEANALNELENKEKEIRLLETQNDVAMQKVSLHRWLTGFLTGGIVLLVLTVVLLAWLRKNQSRINKILSDKNTAIEQQREEILMQAENLQQLNQVKIKLFSVISHDLRGPITNLQVLLDMLTQRIMTPEEFLSVSEKLKVDININQRTLENLLAWSMSQMEGIKTDPQPIEAGRMIEEVTKVMHELAGRKGIQLKNNVTGSFFVSADSDQIQLILRNIIHNAIKFSANHGEILVTAYAEGRSGHISVRDFGVGLSLEEIEILSSTHEYYTRQGTQQEKGTGLGWLLCKEFIKRNGGSFEIKSKQGEGTEVSFTLPLV